MTETRERLHVVVRDGDERDGAALADMLRGLSPTAGFLRFLSGHSAPKPSLVRALLATAPRRGALLAVLPDGRVVGHACWTVDADDVTDVGVVVTDAWQRRGLGRRLVETAVRRSARAGARSMHLDVHPTNRLVVDLLRDRLPGARRAFADGLVTFDVPLALLLDAAACGTSVRDVPAVGALDPRDPQLVVVVPALASGVAGQRVDGVVPPREERLLG